MNIVAYNGCVNSVRVMNMKQKYYLNYSKTIIFFDHVVSAFIISDYKLNNPLLLRSLGATRSLARSVYIDLQKFLEIDYIFFNTVFVCI